MINKYTKLRG